MSKKDDGVFSKEGREIISNAEYAPIMDSTATLLSQTSQGSHVMVCAAEWDAMINDHARLSKRVKELEELLKAI